MKNFHPPLWLNIQQCLCYSEPASGGRYILVHKREAKSNPDLGITSNLNFELFPYMALTPPGSRTKSAVIPHAASRSPSTLTRFSSVSATFSFFFPFQTDALMQLSHVLVEGTTGRGQRVHCPVRRFSAHAKTSQRDTFLPCVFSQEQFSASALKWHQWRSICTASA